MKQFTLDPLPYAYDALEPHFDAETMKLHHDKHHQTYLDKFNAAIATHPELPEIEMEEIIRKLDHVVPEDIRTATTNAGGGFYNHSLFWQMLAPAGTEIGNNTKSALVRSFGSVDRFKEEFTAKALGLFGSGWVWLVEDHENHLSIVTTSNQDNPMSGTDLKVLMALDVWEHAYYLKYQNRRADFVMAWWEVLNWDYIESHLK